MRLRMEGGTQTWKVKSSRLLDKQERSEGVLRNDCKGVRSGSLQSFSSTELIFFWVSLTRFTSGRSGMAVP